MCNDVIIALIAKREYNYIREFVEYHLNLGFDKIYIGDNNNDTNEHYEELLSDYISENKVVILDYRDKESQQITFYNYIIDNIDYEWCAFIDCDEFLTFYPTSGFRNIKDFLSKSGDIKNYHVNWLCYGDNDMCFKTEGKVVDRFKIYKPLTFKYGYNFPENYHIKSIIHKECEGHFRNPHSIQVDNAYNPSSMKVDKGFFSYMDYEILYIRHYFTKSLEEWVDNKMLRNGGNNPHFKYGLDKYFAYNDITEEKINFLKDRGIEYNGEIFNGYYNNVSKKERG